MALELTPEQRALGKSNFATLVGREGHTRRDFMKGLAAAGATVPLTAAAFYGYSRLQGNPVRAALIGAGDEGGVLVGEHNPEYLEFVAVCDLRPSNLKRIFAGESSGPRKGLKRLYGADAEKKIPTYSSIQPILDRKDIQAVVIALPLHLHAPVAVQAMNAGKHVLCEKLMGWNIDQCKKMITAADDTGRILSIGHQRHYSLLYAYAQEIAASAAIGDVHHIRAFWHRHNATPLLDDQGRPMFEPAVDHRTGQPIPDQQWPAYRDSWRPKIAPEDREALASRIREHGYRSMEELVRWRLYQRTGGGLMAELGSHQLDACSIFLGKARPLAVSAIGGKYFYRDDRDAEDHVFCTFEFPGKNYWKNQVGNLVGDKDDKVIVTYSSISTNRYEPYGECVMGTNGTLIVEREEEALLFPTGGRSLAVSVGTTGGKPAADASATVPASEAKGYEQRGNALVGSAALSKGYREEMEHFAYCVRMSEDRNLKADERPQPRCSGRVALADAIIALTANVAMRGTAANGHLPHRIEFKSAWYDPKLPDVPDGDQRPEQA